MFEVFQTQRICWDTNVSFILNKDICMMKDQFYESLLIKTIDEGQKVLQTSVPMSQFKVKTTSLNDWISKILNKYEENIVKYCSHVWMCRLSTLPGKLKYTVRSACRPPPCRRGGFNDKQDLLWPLLAGVFWMMSRVRMFEGCLGITHATRHPGTRDTWHGPGGLH